MKNLKHVLNVNKWTVFIWTMFFSVLDAYYTVKLFTSVNGLGEINPFYRYTPMNITESMIFITITGPLIGFLTYKKYPTITEMIAITVTLFGTVNFISYYFVPLEYKFYLHNILQIVPLVIYFAVSYRKRDKENNQIRPLILPFKKPE